MPTSFPVEEKRSRLVQCRLASPLLASLPPIPVLSSALIRSSLPRRRKSLLRSRALLAPLALIWLAGLHSGALADLSGRPGAHFGSDLGVTVLLMLSGPLMTGGPLMLFSYAARRIRLATLGLVQYLNPTLQFAVATLVFGEAFTLWHAVAFPMIWAALAIYSVGAWRGARHAPPAGARGRAAG